MIWEFFWRFLFSKRAGSVVRRIAWLSFFALLISVTSLVLVISIMTSLNHSMQDRLLAVEPHLVIEAKTGKEWDQVRTHVESRGILDPEWRVFPFETQDVILRTIEGRFRGAQARGMTPSGLDFIMSEIERLDKKPRRQTTQEVGEVSEGSVLRELQRLERGEVLVGVELSHVLGVFEGDSMTVVAPEGLLLPAGEAPKFEKVKVREIITTNLQEFDAQGVFYLQGVTLPSMKNSASVRRGYEIWLPKASDAEKEKRRIAGILSDTPVQISTWRDRNAALFLSLRLEKIVIGLFLTIASLVAGFSLITILGLLISQKTKEIGLLESAGLSQKKVQSLFQGVALRLSGVGLVGGLVLGSALSLYLEKYPLKVLPDIYYNSEVPAYLDVQFVGVVFVVGLLLSWFGGWAVTRKLSQYSPTDLLRSR